MDRLIVSRCGRHLECNGAPFFLLGDTAWLLATRTNREDVIRYMDNRAAKGFNCVLATAVQNGENNCAGVPPFDGEPFASLNDGYFAHIRFVAEEAARRGIWLGLLPAWGSAYIPNGELNTQNCERYARALAKRFCDPDNIIWVLGGDVKGDVSPDVWDIMGGVFQEITPSNLITYHPFGRTRSAQWFHERPWLDFNLFQSGHRRYDQMVLPGSDDDPNPAQWFGEDNWRYVAADLALTPPKPTLDGEPSYEGIPQGLHDASQPFWSDRDARRYAWWSVLGGACGHVYGHNAVMQMWRPSYAPAFGNGMTWDEAIDAPGSGQMRHLKELILSLGSFGRPSQELVAGNGTQYERVAACRGEGFALFYSFTGRPFQTASLPPNASAEWLDPASGIRSPADICAGMATPPQSDKDWALVVRF